MKDPTARRYDRISYQEALGKRLQVMDSAAFSLCMDNRMPIIVLSMDDPENIIRAVMGEEIGTLVTEGPMVASKFGDESLFFKHMRLR